MKNVYLYSQILKDCILSRIEIKDSWAKEELKLEILEAMIEATAKYAGVITQPAKQHPHVDIPVLPISPLEDVEKDKIIDVLRKTSWNISHTARILDIDRKTLRSKIKHFGLTND